MPAAAQAPGALRRPHDALSSARRAPAGDGMRPAPIATMVWPLPRSLRGGRGRSEGRPRRLERSIEIEAPRASVFAWWTRYETLPRILDSVRRAKCVNGSHALWDVEIAGRQLVWESEFVERPGRSVRWRSVWGARTRGELRLVDLGEGRTRLEVEIEYHPRGWLERLGARLGVVEACVTHDLARFRRFAEARARAERNAAGRERRDYGDYERDYGDYEEGPRFHAAS